MSVFKKIRSSLKGDKTDSYLRAARNGNLPKLSNYLKNKNVDINAANNQTGLNALHLSSKEGHIDIVKLLIDSGININSTTKKGNTSLHIASLAGRLDVVKILVAKGASVNTLSQDGFTPLYMAAQENHVDILRFLLANGGDQSLAAKGHFTPLTVAVQQDHHQAAVVLLEADAAGSKQQLPALHVAARKDEAKAAGLLLRNGHSVDLLTKSGFTGLYIAAHYGNVNVARQFISAGANVNFKAKNDIVPLHVAAKWGRDAIVTLLAESGATIDSRTKDGLTPLHCAARNGHVRAVALLLERRAAVTSRTTRGLTPLHMSVQGDHVDTAKLLVQSGRAPVDDVTNDGLTSLHVSAHCGHVRSTRILLEMKCQTSPAAVNGMTPLHVASHRNHVKVVELLISNGAPVDVTTQFGLTPLHVAAFAGHVAVVECLLRHGAVPDCRADPMASRLTALHLAAAAGRSDVIRTLIGANADVTAVAGENITPLKAAAAVGNVHAVTLLLQHSASNETSPDSASAAPVQPDFANRVTLAMSRDERARILAVVSPSALRDHVKYFNETEDEQLIPSVEEPLSAAKVGVQFSERPSSPGAADGATQVLDGVPAAGASESVRQRHQRHHRNGHHSTAHNRVPASFVVDTRGGTLSGKRRRGLRIVVPPGAVCMPTRITCRLIRADRSRGHCLPPLSDGDGLAIGGVLEVGPVGEQFTRCTTLRIARDGQREIIIWSSFDGTKWTPHTAFTTTGSGSSSETKLMAVEDDSDLLEIAAGNTLEAANRVPVQTVHIETSELPRFFAIVSRFTRQVETVAPDGTLASLPHGVKLSFPPNSTSRTINVRIQTVPVGQDLLSSVVNNRVLSASPVISIEPLRRKFRQPITVTLPTPGVKHSSSKGHGRVQLRLMCSVSDGESLATSWEDITESTPLNVSDSTVSFSTLVSAKYWLIEYQRATSSSASASSDEELLQQVADVYREVIAVPYLASVTVFGRRHGKSDGRLQVFCMTDDRPVGRTLERRDGYVKVASLQDIEVLEGRPVYAALNDADRDANIEAVGFEAKRLNQLPLMFRFRAFHENRLPFTVRVLDPNRLAAGRMLLTSATRPSRIANWTTASEESRQTGVVDLHLPDWSSNGVEVEDTVSRKSATLQSSSRPVSSEVQEEHISKAELRLTDIAEALQSDWDILAKQLGLGPTEIDSIRTDFDDDSERALVTLHMWVQAAGPKGQATGNDLERALKVIGRVDVIRRCMYNIKEVTDSAEKAVARGYLDTGYDQLRDEIGSYRELGSSRASSVHNTYSDYESSQCSASLIDTESVYSRNELTASSHAGLSPRTAADRDSYSYVDRSRTPSFYTASLAESDVDTATGYGSEMEPDVEYEVEEVWDGNKWRMVHRALPSGNTTSGTPQIDASTPQPDVSDVLPKAQSGQEYSDALSIPNILVQQATEADHPYPEDEPIQETRETESVGTVEETLQQNKADDYIAFTAVDTELKPVSVGKDLSEIIGQAQEVENVAGDSVEPHSDLIESDLDKTRREHTTLIGTEPIAVTKDNDAADQAPEIAVPVNESVVELARETPTQAARTAEPDVDPITSPEVAKSALVAVDGAQSSPVNDGDISTITEVEELEETLEDGTEVRRKIVTTKQLKPRKTIVRKKGQLPHFTTTDEVIGTSIEEEVLKMELDIIGLDESQLESETVVEESEENHEDGTWTQHKVTTVTWKRRKSTADRKADIRRSLQSQGDNLPRTQEVVENPPDKLYTEIKDSISQPITVTESEAGEQVVTEKGVTEENFAEFSPDKIIEPESSEYVVRDEVVPEEVLEPPESQSDKVIESKTIDQSSEVKVLEEAKETTDGQLDNLTEPEPSEQFISITKDNETADQAPEINVSTSESDVAFAHEKLTHAARTAEPDVDQSTSSEILESASVADDGAQSSLVDDADILTTTEVNELEENLEDGTHVRRKIVTTKHLKPRKNNVRNRGQLQYLTSTEEVIGTIIDEQVLMMDLDIIGLDKSQLESETVVEESEETQVDGTWTQHKVTTVFWKRRQSTTDRKTDIERPLQCHEDLLPRTQVVVEHSPDELYTEIKASISQSDTVSEYEAVELVTENAVIEGTSSESSPDKIIETEPSEQLVQEDVVPDVALEASESHSHIHVLESKTIEQSSEVKVLEAAEESTEGQLDHLAEPEPSEQFISIPKDHETVDQAPETDVSTSESDVAFAHEKLTHAASTAEPDVDQTTSPEIVQSYSVADDGAQSSPVDDEDILTTTEVNELEENLEDGTHVRRKIVTTKHLKPRKTNVRNSGQLPYFTSTEEVIGTIIDEQVLVMNLDIIGLDKSELDSETVVEESEENHEDGTWTQHKVTTVNWKRRQSTANRKTDIERPLQSHGDNLPRTQEVVEHSPDELYTEIKASISQSYTVSEYEAVEPVKENAVIEATSSELSPDKIIETEPSEQLVQEVVPEVALEAPESHSDYHVLESRTIEQRSEVKILEAAEESTEGPLDNLTEPEPSEQFISITKDHETVDQAPETDVPVGESDVAFAHEKLTQAASTAEPDVDQNLSSEIVESASVADDGAQSSPVDDKDMLTTTEVNELEENLEDGTQVRRKIVTTKHLKPRKTNVRNSGHMPHFTSTEEVIGTRIEEDVLKMELGVVGLDESQLESETVVEESEETQEDGTWTQRKITTVSWKKRTFTEDFDLHGSTTPLKVKAVQLTKLEPLSVNKRSENEAAISNAIASESAESEIEEVKADAASVGTVPGAAEGLQTVNVPSITVFCLTKLEPASFVKEQSISVFADDVVSLTNQPAENAASEEAVTPDQEAQQTSVLTPSTATGISVVHLTKLEPFGTVRPVAEHLTETPPEEVRQNDSKEPCAVGVDGGSDLSGAQGSAHAVVSVCDLESQPGSVVIVNYVDVSDVQAPDVATPISTASDGALQKSSGTNDDAFAEDSRTQVPSSSPNDTSLSLPGAVQQPKVIGIAERLTAHDAVPRTPSPGVEEPIIPVPCERQERIPAAVRELVPDIGEVPRREVFVEDIADVAHQDSLEADDQIVEHVASQQHSAPLSTMKSVDEEEIVGVENAPVVYRIPVFKQNAAHLTAQPETLKDGAQPAVEEAKVASLSASGLMCQPPSIQVTTDHQPFKEYIPYEILHSNDDVIIDNVPVAFLTSPTARIASMDDSATNAEASARTSAAEQPVNSSLNHPVAESEEITCDSVDDGPVKMKTEKREQQKLTENGRSVTRKVTTVRFYQPMVNRTLANGRVVETRPVDVMLGSEVDEYVFDAPSDVIDINSASIETQTSVDTTEEVLPDGTWLRRKVTHIIAYLGEEDEDGSVDQSRVVKPTEAAPSENITRSSEVTSNVLNESSVIVGPIARQKTPPNHKQEWSSDSSPIISVTATLQTDVTCSIGNLEPVDCPRLNADCKRDGDNMAQVVEPNKSEDTKYDIERTSSEQIERGIEDSLTLNEKTEKANEILAENVLDSSAKPSVIDAEKPTSETTRSDVISFESTSAEPSLNKTQESMAEKWVEKDSESVNSEIGVPEMVVVEETVLVSRKERILLSALGSRLEAALGPCIEETRSEPIEEDELISIVASFAESAAKGEDQRCEEEQVAVNEVDVNENNSIQRVNRNNLRDFEETWLKIFDQKCVQEDGLSSTGEKTGHETSRASHQLFDAQSKTANDQEKITASAIDDKAEDAVLHLVLDTEVSAVSNIVISSDDASVFNEASLPVSESFVYESITCEESICPAKKKSHTSSELALKLETVLGVCTAGHASVSVVDVEDEDYILPIVSITSESAPEARTFETSFDGVPVYEETLVASVRSGNDKLYKVPSPWERDVHVNVSEDVITSTIAEHPQDILRDHSSFEVTRVAEESGNGEENRPSMNNSGKLLHQAEEQSTSEPFAGEEIVIVRRANYQMSAFNSKLDSVLGPCTAGTIDDEVVEDTIVFTPVESVFSAPSSSDTREFEEITADFPVPEVDMISEVNRKRANVNDFDKVWDTMVTVKSNAMSPHPLAFDAPTASLSVSLEPSAEDKRISPQESVANAVGSSKPELSKMLSSKPRSASSTPAPVTLETEPSTWNVDIDFSNSRRPLPSPDVLDNYTIHQNQQVPARGPSKAYGLPPSRPITSRPRSASDVSRDYYKVVRPPSSRSSRESPVPFVDRMTSSYGRSPTPSSLYGGSDQLDIDFDLDSAADLYSEPVTMPDGSVGRRRVGKPRVKKLVMRKVRKVRNDGEVVEDLVTEDVPEFYGSGDRFSDTSSVRSGSAMSDIVGGPETNGRLSSSLDRRGGFMSPSARTPPLFELQRCTSDRTSSPAGSTSSRRSSGVRVYTDTVEGEPEVITDVQEREETLPDGRVVIRKLIRTRQKQTIVKRIVMENPDDVEDGGLASGGGGGDSSETRRSLDVVASSSTSSHSGLLTYSDAVEMDPVTESVTSDVECVFADGSVSNKTVTKTTTRHMKAERSVAEGPIQIVPDSPADGDVFEAGGRPASRSSTTSDSGGNRVAGQLSSRTRSIPRPRFRISMEPSPTSSMVSASSVGSESGRVSADKSPPKETDRHGLP